MKLCVPTLCGANWILVALTQYTSCKWQPPDSVSNVAPAGCTRCWGHTSGQDSDGRVRFLPSWDQCALRNTSQSCLPRQDTRRVILWQRGEPAGHMLHTCLLSDHCADASADLHEGRSLRQPGGHTSTCVLWFQNWTPTFPFDRAAAEAAGERCRVVLWQCEEPAGGQLGWAGDDLCYWSLDTFLLHRDARAVCT